MHTRIQSPSTSRFFLGGLMFIAAYFTTITVHAQEMRPAPDVIQMNANAVTVITGEIVDADENWVIVNSSGKDMKIVLDKVKLKTEADEVFQKGMTVTVEGKITGDDFGTPLVEASSITATEPPPEAVAPQPVGAR